LKWDGYLFRALGVVYGQDSLKNAGFNMTQAYGPFGR
jgi:hypothetical protein